VVTSHSYWRSWVEVQSSLGRVRVNQVRKKKGKLYGEGGQFFTCRFWVAREELSVEKSTSHVVLEGGHCLAMVMLRKRHVCL
jgi:hypothetical protein